MYPDLFKGLGLKNEDLSRYDTPLVGFDGQVVIPKGQISLPVSMEGKEVTVAFIVVASFSPYTAILGRSWIHAMGVVPSTLHVKVNFSIKQGIAVVSGSQQVARQCLVSAANWKNVRVEQNDQSEKSPYEVPKVDLEFIVHRLNVDPSFPPKKQKPRRSAKEHVEAVKLEVNRLKKAGAIREIFFPDWLANTVVVKKKNGK
ncbi:uncharacterized protein LOC142616345 [Castanea sativa]|uniref:uncharacterized protein LOC142616345 n=1 Tax=Castanea sativa TaxID=21020 RepID=UPI003F64CA2F